MARRRDESATVTRGSTNVFEDLGYPDAIERQAKLRLAYALNQVVERRGLTQAAAANLLGLSQPKVSALRNYKIAGFSVERLMNLLTALDRDIDIVIRRKPRSRKSGRISVVAGVSRTSMPLKPNTRPRKLKSSFMTARRRALARLRKGLDLDWTPPSSREAVHDRGSRRRDR